MKRTITLICTAAAIALPFIARGADMKFQKKAAEKVWKMRPDLFDAHREIPDSLKERFSAVVIGQFDYIDADYQSFQDGRGTETRSEREYFTRRMVKLLDQKAVEDFSKHEFGEKARIRSNYRRNVAETESTFGARIHKPDGSIHDVDMSKSFAVTEGKEGKNTILHKIDIPGLEPGDVLEYFTYTKDKVREFDLPPVRLMLADEYPVLESVIEGKFDPNLTVEFRGFNGAPDMQCGTDDKGKNKATQHIGYIPAITDRHYVNKTRTVPFYSFYVLNNTSPYRFYPKQMRRGGLYQNPLAGTIFRDISLTIAASDYSGSKMPGKVRKLIKDFRTANPEASADQLTDMAWTAANYVNMTDKDTDVSDYWLALMMCDILKKEKIADNAGVAFINPSNDVPTQEIINWRQPDFGMLIGNRIYLATDFNTFLPSELPPRYQGQMAAAYPGDREKLWNFTMPTIVETPLSKSGENRFAIKSTITLCEDNDAIVANELTLTGAMKYLAAPLTNFHEWIAAQEDYLGIAPQKRYKPKNADTEKRAGEIEAAVGEIYEDIYTGENCKLSDFNILSRGITPDSREFRLTFASKAPEAYTRAGDELLVKIGNFAGRQPKAEASERTRTSDITFMAASQDNYNLVVNLPEGYDVDEDALQALANNIQTPVGIFVTSAKKGADGRSVTVASRFRINHPLLGTAAWPEILKLTDARAAFTDALLVLKKK